MTEPIEIPLPSTLDSQRGHLASSGSEEQRREAVQQAYAEATEYGRQLWHRLDEIRTYLLESAPTTGRSAARPTGPDDDAGWLAWQRAYADVTTVLAGPRGDSGFGEQEAVREVTQRRAARPSGNELAPARAAGWQPPTPLPARVATVLAVAGVTVTVRELAVRLWRSR